MELLVYVEEERKKRELIHLVKDAVALSTDEEILILEYKRQPDGHERAQAEHQVSAAIVDVTGREGILAAEEIRLFYTDVEIMIVADVSVSPVLYLNPKVRAASLLLRPIVEKQAMDIVCSFIHLFAVDKKNLQMEGSFSLVKRTETVQIPYKDILYFEARDKKLYVRYGRNEQAFYMSMDSLTETLPENFFRCHRSFVVNLEKIVSVNYSENLILFEENEMIPLSRGYKSELKEVMNR